MIDSAPTNCAHSIDRRMVIKEVLELLNSVHHSQPKNMQPSKSGKNPLPGPHAPQEPSNILKLPLAHSLQSLPVYLQQENTHELKNITEKQARGVLP